MNKNIKWSLILSAPVLALAPVAVVASCSSTDSTNSDTKTETKTKAEIRILDFCLLYTSDAADDNRLV